MLQVYILVLWRAMEVKEKIKRRKRNDERTRNISRADQKVKQEFGRTTG